MKLQKELKINDVDQIIISDFYNILYFTGLKIHSGERLLVLLVSQDGLPTLFVNELFLVEENAEFQLSFFNDTQDSIAVLASKLKGNKIAIDHNWPSGFLLKLMSNKQASYIDGSMIISKLRAIKDIQEQAYMLQSSINNDEVMRRIKGYIKEGVSEIYIANILKQLFTEVAGDESFDAIVAFGENGANPHAEPSERKLRRGDSIIIDMGCHHKDYCSDMTRTFFFQEKTLDNIYDVVLQANLAAISNIKPGVLFSDIDLAARSVIEQAGYGEYFTHRTGHGIGLEVHEPFDVSSSDHRVVEAGMCFSIEPGIYIKNKGGVRIEDLVLVTNDGVQVLNNFSKTDYLIN